MLIERLGSAGCDLALAGGKGANLSTLVRAGFPVPEGFVVTTDAYRRFVETEALSEWIPRMAEAASRDDATLESTSTAIRERFSTSPMPDEIADAVKEAYEELGGTAVAVRSSATAEDLPDLSFAGQQETFLNIVTEQALLEAVVRCWSSLWTARAISYRARNQIGHREIALAVIVERMVVSESSGVLFTANPVTGRRTEAVVEAVLGLGEALVSGRVDPDRYSIAMPECKIASKTLGSKDVSVRPRSEGGTADHEEQAALRQALPDDAIVELARLGKRAAELFRGPQDIEWAWADGMLWLLQSRPITSLYPLPEGVQPEPAQVFFSIGAVQGMLDPFTPLGQDIIRKGLARAVARRFGFAGDDAPVPIVIAGERLFVNVTRLVRHRFIRDRIAMGLTLFEPGTHELLKRLMRDPRFAPAPSVIPYPSLWRFARVGVRVPINVLLNLIRPGARRANMLGRVDAAVASLEQRRTAALGIRDVMTLLDDALEVVPRNLIPYLASGVAAGLAMLQLLRMLAHGVPDGEADVLEATRGLPYNVTTEMDLALWRAARDGSEHALDDFLKHYGMRGVGEIDIGCPRWRDDTAQLEAVMESYRRLPAEQAPDAVFARGAASAEAALERLTSRLRNRRGGWWRAPLARWAGGRMRALAGLRELPKFFIIRVMGILRNALLDAFGPDIFFMRLDELRALASNEQHDYGTLVASRRAAYEREKRRRHVPRLLMSGGEAWYGDEIETAETAGVLAGAGVSPGIVEGIARIVFDPRTARLAPGDILVCPGADPAWTPLFLTAGGLVMEVGGLLTHGSVVAREYGIPAVAGVHHATTRLADGQRIRVDGLTGKVTII